MTREGTSGGTVAPSGSFVVHVAGWSPVCHALSLLNNDRQRKP